MYRRFKEILIAPYYTPLTSITDQYMFYEGLLSDVSCNMVEQNHKLDMFDLIDEDRRTIRDWINS